MSKTHRDTLYVEDATVVSVERFPGEQFVLRLQAPECAASATPGSFVHVRCDDAIPMRRPLSIMRV
ncbi:MAG: dihydroorotate dehydrogenase electron transfer subunit, partial [Woeseia sp.]